MIALGAHDPIFNAQNFPRLPIKLIEATANVLSKEKQNIINASSVSVAKLSCLVYSALAGKKQSADVRAFLPFEMPKSASAAAESTIAVLKWALKNEKLPPAIVGMIGAELS